MIEEWKNVKTYEGYYRVSNLGSVKSLERTTCQGHLLSERILTPCKDNVGYLHVMLCKDGSNQLFKIHRLVATAFLPNPDNKPQVNHKDGDKTFNSKTNLEWVTAKENKDHASLVLNKTAFGEDHTNAKLTETEVFEILNLLDSTNLTQREIAGLYRVSQTQVSRINHGQKWERIYLKFKEGKLLWTLKT